MDTADRGLTPIQVAERRSAGQTNAVHTTASQGYLEIVRRNAFTFINTVLLGIGVVLVLMGETDDALVTAGLVLLNVIVTVIQEGRAKRALDRIALLTRPHATVLRDGKEVSLDPAEVVLGDVLVARPGDQIVVDGRIVGDGVLEVDESLLTGESDATRKGPGDEVLSGSFCVSGQSPYEATRVGADAYANRLTFAARAYRRVRTPLQREIDFVVRVLVILVSLLGALLLLSFLVADVPLVEGVKVGAVIVALVPQGLFFMTTVAYAMGAYRVAERGALVQQANAVESTSNVTVLCLDKTGTLTSNRIFLRHVQPLPGCDRDEAGLRALLGAYAASTEASNRTNAAIAAACPADPQPVREAVPFSSERKWSALALDGKQPGTYVLGAPEMLLPHIAAVEGLEQRVTEWANQGVRVLLFARAPEREPLHGPSGEPHMPSGLCPLALLAMGDELRPHTRETLTRFEELGVSLKVISGDNPDTVAALARQVGFPEGLSTLSGIELAAMDDAALDDTVERVTVFGRTTPEQKERLVRTLRRQGHYVAMVGDGVNDVLPLKQAHLAVAMQSGSAATRSVADLILLNDSFAALPAALREGQRIVRGMEDVVRLLLTRTLYVILLIVATRIVGLPFPLTPKHNSILALLTVGIPIVAIAAWARPGRPAQRILRATSHFVLPAAFSIAVLGVGVYLFFLQTGSDVQVARTALTTVTVLAGLLLVPFVEPPTSAWVGGDALSGDRRPALLALGMLLVYAAIVTVPGLRSFFELAALQPSQQAIIAGVAAAWAVVLRGIWRGRVFERLLTPPPVPARASRQRLDVAASAQSPRSGRAARPSVRGKTNRGQDSQD